MIASIVARMASVRIIDSSADSLLAIEVFNIFTLNSDRVDSKYLSPSNIDNGKR